MLKRYTEQSVIDAARERISWTFDNFERRPVDMGALLPRCVLSEDES